jgi:hypothetical protein
MYTITMRGQFLGGPTLFFMDFLIREVMRIGPRRRGQTGEEAAAWEFAARPKETSVSRSSSMRSALFFESRNFAATSSPGDAGQKLTLLRPPPLCGEGWEGGGRLGRIDIPSFGKQFHNAVNVVVHFLIAKADDPIAFTQLPVRATHVAVDGIRLFILRAIEFLDEISAGQPMEFGTRVGWQPRSLR